MSQLEVFYEVEPVAAKGKVAIRQSPIAAAAGLRSTDGEIQPSLVYVRPPITGEIVLVPFGEYEEWSLRDKYNEALRIMNALGASSIVCESFSEVHVNRGLFMKLPGRGAGGSVKKKRQNSSSFDFSQSGLGSAPSDPGQLRWPTEPGFSAAVDSVLRNKATKVELTIRSERTYSITGKLAGQLQGLGLELGGEAKNRSATTLEIRAEFPNSKKKLF